MSGSGVTRTSQVLRAHRVITTDEESITAHRHHDRQRAPGAMLGGGGRHRQRIRIITDAARASREATDAQDAARITLTSIIVPVSRREHQATGAGFSLSACAIREISRAISSVPLSGVTSMYRTPAFRSASFLTASRAAAVPW